MCRRIFKDQTSETGDIPFYKIGTFGGEPDAFISTELFEEYKAKYPYPKKGDILISASGSIGRTVEFTGKKEYFQDSNIVWLNHDEHLDNTFLKCFYNVVRWSGLEGSTIKRLYNDNILKTEISVPSIEEQRKIGAYFEQLNNLITLHQWKSKIYEMIMGITERQRKPLKIDIKMQIKVFHIVNLVYKLEIVYSFYYKIIRLRFYKVEGNNVELISFKDKCLIFIIGVVNIICFILFYHQYLMCIKILSIFVKINIFITRRR